MYYRGAAAAIVVYDISKKVRFYYSHTDFNNDVGDDRNSEGCNDDDDDNDGTDDDDNNNYDYMYIYFLQ